MTNSEKQEIDIGPSPSSSENPRSPMSRTRKTKQESPSESTSAQSINGSKISEIPKETIKSSDPGPLSGSKTTKSLMPVPKPPAPPVDRKHDALVRLKVKPEVLAITPEITPTIKLCVKGGLTTALEAMRFSTDDEIVVAFLRKYDSIPIGDRESLPWEAIALAAKVDTRHLIGSILLAVTQHCAMKSKLIVASNHPDIVDKRIEFAKMAGGEKDRSALDIMAGAQQGPSGHTFIGKAWFGAGGNTSASGKALAKSDDADEAAVSTPQATYEDSYADLFPSPKETQDSLVAIRQKRLTEG